MHLANQTRDSFTLNYGIREKLFWSRKLHRKDNLQELDPLHSTRLKIRALKQIMGSNPGVAFGCSMDITLNIMTSGDQLKLAKVGFIKSGRIFKKNLFG